MFSPPVISSFCSWSFVTTSSSVPFAADSVSPFVTREASAGSVPPDCGSSLLT
uniref:Uncharacterized protein n=1 Tax=Anguilla anguilla TaxID=7936 RepID=A0A0E9TZJ9_ANGAN